MTYLEAISSMTSEDLSVEKVSLLLAMTNSREKEDALKTFYSEKGYQCGISEISGMNDELRKKMVSTVIGTSLNLEIIEKKSKEIHAVVHATLEACHVLNIGIPLIESFSLKMGIARKGEWIGVAFYGVRAIHKMTNQTALGLGVMHI